LALAAPLAMRPKWLPAWLRPKVLLPFCVVALPWYLLCYSRNGWPFIEEFIVRHHFGRFASGALQHVQPWWFYLTRLPLLLLPWMPLLALAAARSGWKDPRRRFLAIQVLFGLLLFSAGANKLPGYVLPLFPALAALAGAALDELADARGWLVACAALLVVFPIAAPVLPAALANEWDSAPKIAFHWSWLLPAVPVAAAAALEGRGKRVAAVLVIACSTATGLTYLKVRSEGELARIASAKELAEQVRRHAGEVCAGALKRDWQYGLYYYAESVLPSCDTKPLRFQVLQTPGRPPELVPRVTGDGTSTGMPSVDPK
jgi:4-amino-4-deoxy-L-arabinose transferase-like glycosyltransferase